MELNSLRSQLQHACPDLRNLTNIELEEGKWLTKKKVFINLIAGSRSLQDQNEELIDLNEERNAESALQKSQAVSREIRLESETVFRTKFMRIVLSGLSRLKWPPSQEAFSDPLDSLFNDPSTFRNAAEFLVRVAFPSSVDPYYQPEDFTPTKSSPRPKSTIPTFSTLAQDVSAMDISHISKVSMETSDREDESMKFSFGCEKTNFTPRLPFTPGGALEDPRFEASVSTNPRDKKQALNWKAFELLQRQNETLSVRLRELQLSVQKRDESEVKISGILSELKSTITELVDAGGGRKSHARPDSEGGSILRDQGRLVPANETSAAAASASKKQEMELFRLEVEREKEGKLAEKDKSLGISQLGAAKNVKGRPPVAVRAPEADRKASFIPPFAGSSDGSDGGSSVLWSRLLARVSSLEAQWTSAQRAARSLADHHHGSGSGNGKSPLGPKGGGSSSSRHPSSTGGSAGGMLSGVLFAAQATPSRSLVGKTFGVQPALLAGRDDYSFGGDGGTGGGFGPGFNSPPQPPSSRQSQYSAYSTGGGGGESAAATQGGGLDLSRVHLLQRDLIQFAERALAWTADSLFVAPQLASEVPHSAVLTRRGVSAQSPYALPTTDQAVRRQQEAQALQGVAWELLLHLSGIAPIVPLALDSPLRSSMTGLDALIQEVGHLYLLFILC